MKKFVLLLTAFMFFFLYNIQAQHIKRKGKLGVYLSKAEANEAQAPFKVQKILEQSTAENMAMLVDDIIVSINGQLFNSNQAIKSIVASFHEGETVSGLVIRSGKEVKLKGKVLAPPINPLSERAEVILGEVAFRDGYIRSIVNKPKGKGPFKTIFYIQGYPCQSVDYQYPHPTMQLIEAMLAQGYAVYRVEKPGAGEFYNCKPCMEQSFTDELEGFRKGYEHLRDQPFVDKSQIYIFGHSLGGNVAPILASEYKPAGVMVYGTLVKPWQEYLVDMARYTQPLSESDLTVPEHKISILRDIQRKIYEENVPLAKLSKEEKALLADWQDLKGDQFLFNRDFSFWKDFDRYKFVEEWNKVDVPTLAMYGSTDVHAISSLDAEFIANIVNKNHPGKGTFKLVQNTDHLFALVESKLEELDYINNGSIGQVAYTRFNKDFPDIVHQWISQISQKASTEKFDIASKLIPQELTTMSTMDVESADLDGDGKKDIIIASEFGPNRIFFNTGSGFQEDSERLLPALKTYNAPFKGEDSEDIAIADFDQDGDLDLLFVSEDTDNHELLYNDGDGGFTFTGQQIPKLGDANAVLIYDFNKDEFPDVLIGIRGRNELYINQKGQSFKNKTNSLWPKNSDSTQDLILADVDNDGDMDIVEGIEDGGNNLYINGKKGFSEAKDRLPDLGDYETRKVGALDADNDGDQDLFFCNVAWSNDKIPQNLLLLNDGKGYFKIASEAVPKDYATTLDVLFMDLNEDGKADMITTGMGDINNFKVFLNHSSDGHVIFKEDKSIFPKVSLGNGIAMISDKFLDGKLGIYMGNYKEKDLLLMEK